jgi:hypothetical protein
MIKMGNITTSNNKTVRPHIEYVVSKVRHEFHNEAIPLRQRIANIHNIYEDHKFLFDTRFPHYFKLEQTCSNYAFLSLIGTVYNHAINMVAYTDINGSVYELNTGSDIHSSKEPQDSLHKCYSVAERSDVMDGSVDVDSAIPESDGKIEPCSSEDQYIRWGHDPESDEVHKATVKCPHVKIGCPSGTCVTSSFLLSLETHAQSIGDGRKVILSADPQQVRADRVMLKEHVPYDGKPVSLTVPIKGTHNLIAELVEEDGTLLACDKIKFTVTKVIDRDAKQLPSHDPKKDYYDSKSVTKLSSHKSYPLRACKPVKYEKAKKPKKVYYQKVYEESSEEEESCPKPSCKKPKKKKCKTCHKKKCKCPVDSDISLSEDEVAPKPKKCKGVVYSSSSEDESKKKYYKNKKCGESSSSEDIDIDGESLLDGENC